MEHTVYKPEEILQIQMATRVLLNDALGRYIHDPGNMRSIQDILGGGLAELKKIVTESTKGCPPGYSHVDCSCTVDVQ